MKTFWLKTELSFFQLERFVDKATFNSYSFKKVIDFVTT